MKHLTTGFVLFFLANSVVLGQPIHKSARLHIQTMPDNLDSAIRSQIIKQKVLVRIVDVPEEAELIMKETSGFTGIQRHKQGIRLIIEIFDPAGSKRWPGEPEDRFYWIKKASPGWQSKVAKRVAKKLSRGIQRYTTTASFADTWWPFPKTEKGKGVGPTTVDTKARQTTSPADESTQASERSTYRTPPSEVDVKWAQKDKTPVETRISQRPLEVKFGMTEEEVRDVFGDPLKIARLKDKTIYKYEDTVVEFQDGKVSEVKFQ